MNLLGFPRRRLAAAAGLAMAIAGAAAVGLGHSGPLAASPAGLQAEAAARAPPDAEGSRLFRSYCMACHGNPIVAFAPAPGTVQGLSPERIYSALANGVMRSIGDQLTETEKREVAEAAAGRAMGSDKGGAAADMPNRCAAGPPMTPTAEDWNGWGRDEANTRFQAAPGLAPADAPRLKLRWAFGLPGATSAYSEPTVVGGRVFVASDSGFVYALDARTGCVHWSFYAKAGVRNAVVIAPVAHRPGVRYAAYFGDLEANAYALDAETGRLLWTVRADDHVSSRITASPAVWGGRVFVPISSWESASARSEDYPCCTFQGKVVALDGATGATLWRRSAFDQPPARVGRNARGVPRFAPAGAAVWNTPTVDPRRGAIYFGTGNAYTYPAPAAADAVMALRMTDGQRLWTHQVHAGDAALAGCRGAEPASNCPEIEGPDWDVPASPILRVLPGGRRVLVVASKSGDVLALDPDRGGAQVWRMNVNGKLASDRSPAATAPPPRGPLFGGAADGQAAYFGLAGGGGGMAAVRLSDGKLQWLVPLEWTAQRPVAYPAAVSAAPGLALAAGDDGRLAAVSAATGQRLWDFDAARPFRTVNGVEAHGGSFGSAGPVAAEGMLFAASGYAFSVTGARAKPGNVLLAFAPD
jgi:polyvinyl alcohol dehydrogenase (cytochrome)